MKVHKCRDVAVGIDFYAERGAEFRRYFQLYGLSSALRPCAALRESPDDADFLER